MRTPFLENNAPDPIDCNAVIAGLVPKIRLAVYPRPKLFTKETERASGGSKHARDESKRRNLERKWLREISQYYKVPETCKKGLWDRPKLILRGKHDVTLDMLTKFAYPSS